MQGLKYKSTPGAKKETVTPKQKKALRHTNIYQAIIRAAKKKLEKEYGLPEKDFSQEQEKQLTDQLKNAPKQTLSSADLLNIAMFGVISLQVSGGVRPVNYSTPYNYVSFVDFHADLFKGDAESAIDQNNADTFVDAINKSELTPEAKQEITAAGPAALPNPSDAPRPS